MKLQDAFTDYTQYSFLIETAEWFDGAFGSCEFGWLARKYAARYKDRGFNIQPHRFLPRS